MIAIIDYGVGNLCNLKNAFDFLDLPNQIVSDQASLENASHIILPGVGAFRPAMEHLREVGLEDAVRKVIKSGRPFLGICVGMQLMFDESEEDGSHQGLGLIKGRVVRFNHDMKIPQIGWNRVTFQHVDPLLENVPDESYFYFVHSYHPVLEDAQEALGLTEYGDTFPSIVRRANMWGVQFHPEKSQEPGLQLLKNFARIKPE